MDSIWFWIGVELDTAVVGAWGMALWLRCLFGFFFGGVQVPRNHWSLVGDVLSFSFLFSRDKGHAEPTPHRFSAFGFSQWTVGEIHEMVRKETHRRMTFGRQGLFPTWMFNPLRHMATSPSSHCYNLGLASKPRTLTD